MKKTLRILAAFVLAAMMVAVMVLPVTDALAADVDLTDVIDFIDDVRLTDRSGTPFGPDTPKDAQLLLTYEFSIPNDADVFDTDYFRLPVPAEILLTAGPDIEVRHNVTNDLIAVVSKDMGPRELRVTFTDHASLNSNVQGEFSLELAFDESNIGDDDPTTITFEVGAQTDDFLIDVYFDQTPPLEASVIKSGDYDQNTREITWTVTANTEELEVINAALTEDIPDGLTFVPGSVRVKEGSAAWRAAVLGVDYTYSDPTLTYTFPATITEVYLVEFKTTVDESEFRVDPNDPNSDYLDQGDIVVQSNQITLNHDDGTSYSNEANVDVEVNLIEKEGSYDSGNVLIEWTIVVNRIGVSIPDAVVTDEIPEGLILDTGSLEVDGSPWTVTGAPATSGNANFVDPDLTIALGTIAEPHVITFCTDVDPAWLKENGPEEGNLYHFVNGAFLTGTHVPGGTYNENEIPVAVPSAVLNKVGAGYDPETHEITWWIAANSNGIAITGGEITDVIPAGQTFVPGSVRVKEGAAAWRDAVLGVDYTYSDPTLTYTLPATITAEHVIEFKTTVDNVYHYAVNSEQLYSNEALMTWDGGNSENDIGQQPVISEVLQKLGAGYNYETGEITWTVQVNQNKMDLTSVVVSDSIGDGQEYVNGSFQITGGPQTGLLVENPNYWIYTFDGPITDEYNITFKTLVTDYSDFTTNGDKTFSNIAQINTNLVPEGMTTPGEQTIKNTVIGKTGTYTPGETVIHWTVTVNTNDIDLIDGLISDPLQTGLALDTTSVKLYHATVDSVTGDLVQGAEIALDSSNVVYSIDTNLFEFMLPTPVAGGYILTFTTDVTDKSQSPFVNTVYFSGSGDDEQGESESIEVSWTGAGSSGTSEVGSMNILKVDADNTSTRLQYAEFELEDKYGNIVQRATSDANGSALFERLRFDVDYTIRETQAPDGYIGSALDYSFQIDSEADDVDLEYTFTNDRIYGSIRLYKMTSSEEPLGGAVFELYAAADVAYDNPLMSATSASNGIVRFNNVQFGDYLIREVSAPDGYVRSQTPIEVTVSGHGVEVDAGTVINTPSDEPENPETGNDSYTALLILLGSALVLGAGLLIGQWQKRKAAHRSES